MIKNPYLTFSSQRLSTPNVRESEDLENSIRSYNMKISKNQPLQEIKSSRTDTIPTGVSYIQNRKMPLLKKDENKDNFCISRDNQFTFDRMQNLQVTSKIRKSMNVHNGINNQSERLSHEGKQKSMGFLSARKSGEIFREAERILGKDKEKYYQTDERYKQLDNDKYALNNYVEHFKRDTSTGQYCVAKRMSIQHPSSYVLAMRALQDRIKQLEQLLADNQNQYYAKQTITLLENLEDSQRLLLDFKEKDKNQEISICELRSLNNILQTQNNQHLAGCEQSNYKMLQLHDQLDNLRISHSQEIEKYKLDFQELQIKLDQEHNENIQQKNINHNLISESKKQQNSEVDFRLLLEAQKQDEINQYRQLNLEQIDKALQLQKQIKKKDKSYLEVQNEKHLIQTQFDEYKRLVPEYRYQEQERVIRQLENDTIKKEEQFNKQIDDLLTQKNQGEQDQNKKVKQLMTQNNENQAQLHQMTIEYQDLNQDHVNLKQEYEFIKGGYRALKKSGEKQYLSKSRLIDNEYESRRPTVGKLSSDSFSAPHSRRQSPKFQMQRSPHQNSVNASQQFASQQLVDVPELKNVSKQCFFESLKDQNSNIYPNLEPANSNLTLTQLRPPIQFHFQKNNQTAPLKTEKSHHDSVDTARHNGNKKGKNNQKIYYESDIQAKILQLEILQRDCNEKYEILLRQALIEIEYKQKAAIRHQLLEMADEMKLIGKKMFKLKQQLKKAQVNSNKN